MNPQLRTGSVASAFKVTGGIYTMTTLELHSSDSSLLISQLESLISKAPSFFENTPTLIALDTLQETNSYIDILQLRNILTQYGMILVAIRGGSELNKNNALMAGIAWLPATSQNTKTATSNNESNVVLMNQAGNTATQPASSPISEPLSHETKIIDQPVRSGQQIYSSGDLIITNTVSAGAELLAGGNIHVYGALRGRALAGVNGNNSSRIFCLQFEAELISINGQYKIPNDTDTFQSLWGQPVLIDLKQNILHIRQL